MHFDRPQHALFTKNEIQNLKLLRGKKIAVAGPGVVDDLLLRDFLAANGIDGGRDVSILSIGAADTRVASLIGGAVDAAMLIAPFTFTAKDAGFREFAVFRDQGFFLPSGGIVAQGRVGDSPIPRWWSASCERRPWALSIRATIGVGRSKC